MEGVLLDRRCVFASSSTSSLYKNIQSSRQKQQWRLLPRGRRGFFFHIHHRKDRSESLLSRFGKNTEKCPGHCEWKLSASKHRLSTNTTFVLRQSVQTSKRPGSVCVCVCPAAARVENRTPPAGGWEVLQADEYIKGSLRWTAQSLVAVTLHALFVCWVRVDVKASDGPEATQKGKILGVLYGVLTEY